jgi:hypothetical protein
VRAQAVEPIAGTRPTRVSYLDWLKVLLVALIIVWHGVAGYTDLESAWPYQDVQEVRLTEFSHNLLRMLVLPGCCSRWASSS